MKMVKINFIIFILSFFCSVGYGQVLTASDSIVLSGVIMNTQTKQALADVHCRYGKTKGTVSDEEGCFRLKLQRGDSVLFTYVGFKPFTVVIPDTLYEHEYIIGVFMSPDTLLLSEALIIRRWQDSWRQNMINVQNNMAGILKQAFAPVKNMDADMNQRMMVNEYARMVEMKGHVEVGVGVGTQSLESYRLLRMRKRLNEKKSWVNPDEIDLLKKLYYLEKRKKQDN